MQLEFGFAHAACENPKEFLVALIDIRCQREVRQTRRCSWARR